MSIKKLSKVLVVLMLVLILSAPVFSMQLSDTENHWAKKSIDELVSLGYIRGNPDGTFRPDNTITVAEFITIITRTIDNTIQPSNTDWHWVAPFMQKALDTQIIKLGDFDSIDRNITRGEIAMIIVRTLAEELQDNYDVDTSLIVDYSSIPSLKREYISKAFALGIMGGYPDGYFHSDRASTRAEASIMIIRMLSPVKRVNHQLP